MSIEWKTSTVKPRARRERAIANLEALIAAQPDRFEPKLLLAQLLFDANRTADIPALLCDPIPLPHALQRALHLGRARRLLGDHRGAIALLREPAEAGYPRADAELAQALTQDGRRNDALDVARRGLGRSSDDIACLRVAGMTLLEQGRAGEAYDLARSLWDAGVHRAQAIWTMACAARALGRDDEFHRLTTREPWFAREHLDVDNDTLAREILANETLAPAQAYRPTRGRARRIDNFEAAASDAARALHGAVQAAMERYRAARLSHTDHPLMAGWPPRMAMDSWALAMNDDGHEDWHIHASAWLSAVYYVRNPARGLDTPAGRIGFGALPVMAALKGPPIEAWTVTPEPGLLVIFPAWYAHRTWPTGVAKERISVAFNAMPASVRRDAPTQPTASAAAHWRRWRQ